MSLAIHRTASSHLSASYITILSDAPLCLSNNRSRQLMFLFLKTDGVHMGDSTSCFWKSWQKLQCKLYFNIVLLTPHKRDPNGLWKAPLCDQLRVRLVLLYNGIVHMKAVFECPENENRPILFLLAAIQMQIYMNISSDGASAYTAKQLPQRCTHPQVKVTMRHALSQMAPQNELSCCWWPFIQVCVVCTYEVHAYGFDCLVWGV